LEKFLKMPTSKNQSNWIYKIAKKVSKEYSLKFEIKKSGHYKIKFHDQNGVTCIFNFPSTPSCWRSRRNALSTIKFVLSEKFGVEIDKSKYTLQFFQS